MSKFYIILSIVCGILGLYGLFSDIAHHQIWWAVVDFLLPPIGVVRGFSFLMS